MTGHTDAAAAERPQRHERAAPRPFAARLINRDGDPDRIWTNAHIKGPDGAPQLHGEKVAVLARQPEPVTTQGPRSHPATRSLTHPRHERQLHQ
ncbi:MAG TPA: hypothetical protein VF755_20555 [Catenuloplanes sp.]|jgi:hypothetical protein